MEVKPGYKQTEVGVIPEDWNVFQLSDHFRIYAGGDVPKHSVSKSRSETHPYPIFANALQDCGLYGFTGERRSKADSLTITARGYLGHAEYRGEAFFPIVRLLVLEPGGALDSRFTTFAVNERVKFAFESTGVPQLTAPQVGKYSVAAPPIPEQRAIAEALSDVDRLLDGLDRLIAKKRNLKQATMQQLLTGQTRLPGFHSGSSTKLRFKVTEAGEIPEDWNLDYVERIAHITTGNRNTQDNVEDGQYPFFVRSQKVERINTYSFDGEAVLTAGDGVGTGKVFHYINGKFDVHQRVYRISDFSEQVNGYFFYLYFSTRFYGRIMQMTAKSSVDSVRREMIARMLIPLPPTKAEQTAIAEVLTEMDAELAALEQRREKTRALKQAMMQELLTGKTRLA